MLEKLHLCYYVVMSVTSASCSPYSKGSLSCSDKNWFHGELTRKEAEQCLRATGYDCFLVRQSERLLFLSLAHHGKIHHMSINYGSGWYELENSLLRQKFAEINDLVMHYSDHIINGDLRTTLGEACEKMHLQPGTYVHIFFLAQTYYFGLKSQLRKSLLSECCSIFFLVDSLFLLMQENTSLVGQN